MNDMGLLDMFNRKNENPFFTKLRRLYAGKTAGIDIARAFFLGGVIYTDQNLKGIRKAISANRLSQFIQDNDYNSQKDCIEVYWIENRVGEKKLVLVLDAFELYLKEEILDEIAVHADILDIFGDKKQIYP